MPGYRDPERRKKAALERDHDVSFDHLAVLAGDGGEDTHTYVHADPRLRVTRTGLDGALDEHPESGHQPGPAAGDSRGEDAGSALGDQPLQAAGVLGLTRAFDRALAPDPVPDTPGMA